MTISNVGSNNPYESLSSGYRINRSADDAAGLAISQKLERQTTGYEVGSENAKDGMSLINIADGALQGMQDALQRMRELGIRAMNGLATEDDKAAYQVEVDQLKEHIQSIAKSTNFNTVKLLDGSMADLHLATNPEGSGLKIQLENTTLESLGIADFNVLGDYQDIDLDAIDKAMDKVNSARSRMGAQYNRLEHTVANNDYTNYNLTAANSRIKDADYSEEIIKKNRDDALQSYKIFALKSKMTVDGGFLRLF